MPEYTPPETPELTVHFGFLPGEPQTGWEPEVRPEVEFHDIEVNGDFVSLALYDKLIEICGDTWEAEIIELASKNKRRVA